VIAPTLSLNRWIAHLGGTRIFALPAIRILAAVSGLEWVMVAPRAFPTWGAATALVVAFALYSLAIIAALWLRPGPVLRRNVWVLAADLAFALGLIALTGGAESALFNALLLIAALQSYYYGIRRGMGVAAVSLVGYLVVVWPTLGDVAWANVAIQLSVLAGTAVGAGVLADVESGERRKVHALTREAEERERFIRQVVESLREGVVAIDGNGCVVAWNAAMEALGARAAAAAIGRPLAECVPAFGREPVAERLRALLAGTADAFTAEAVEHAGPDGRRMVLNVKGSPLRERDRQAGAVLLVEDVAERLAMERSARQTEKLAALGTLAAGLAHELNNPIGIISSRIELMLLDAETQPLPAGVREDLDVLHRHAQRVARTGQSLLSFARQSPGRVAAMDLNHLLEETLVLIEKTLVKDGVSVTRSLALDLPPVWGDENAIQQVVLNLLTNARDAIGGHGEIAVETSRADGAHGGVRLSVRDSGAGIEPELLPRIFDPFFTTKPQGTGLGLSILYGIVRDHRGTVDVQSERGKGTTFVLTFPSEDPR
jgi:PAS domain S-box-containing protein